MADIIKILEKYGMVLIRGNAVDFPYHGYFRYFSGHPYCIDEAFPD